MYKKKIITRVIILIVLIGLLMPAFVMRIQNESKNNNVVVSLNYNSASMVLNEEEFEKNIDNNKKIGVNTMTIGEESVNSLVSSGMMTVIRYNVLSHKFDEESEDLLKRISDNKKIKNDSYVFISKRQAGKDYLNKWIPSKFAKNEYMKTTTCNGGDAYIIYEFRGEQWQFGVGVDESKLKNSSEKGMDIALAFMVYPYTNTQYIDELDKLIKKYDIKYILLKNSFAKVNSKSAYKENKNKICSLLRDNDITLVVVENQDQLSNQKPYGYNDFVKAAEGKVIRCFEPAVNMNAKSRYYQMLNSVVDRNIRFVNVFQIQSKTGSNYEKAVQTNKASEKFMDKIHEFDYTTNGEITPLADYVPNRRFNYSVATIIMAIMLITIIELLYGKPIKWLEVAAYIMGLCACFVTFIMPVKFMLLYPSLYAVIAPSFVFAIVLRSIKILKDKLSTYKLVLMTVFITFATLLVFAIIQSVLLSGFDFYLNNLIFRGIKLSLIAPVAFCLIAFPMIYAKKRKCNFVEKFVEFMKSDIKVYWVILGGIIMFVGFTYIRRSGNVSSISHLEALMRNTITNFIQARPRTKEFMVGWPALVLFVYYVKNTDCFILKWILALGSSILFASVINSFCHVFTDVSIIYMRVVNGLALGIIISVIAYIINLILVKLFYKLKKFVIIK